MLGTVYPIDELFAAMAANSFGLAGFGEVMALLTDHRNPSAGFSAGTAEVGQFSTSGSVLLPVPFYRFALEGNGAVLPVGGEDRIVHGTIHTEQWKTEDDAEDWEADLIRITNIPARIFFSLPIARDLYRHFEAAAMMEDLGLSSREIVSGVLSVSPAGVEASTYFNLARAVEHPSEMAALQELVWKVLDDRKLHDMAALLDRLYEISLGTTGILTDGEPDLVGPDGLLTHGVMPRTTVNLRLPAEDLKLLQSVVRRTGTYETDFAYRPMTALSGFCCALQNPDTDSSLRIGCSSRYPLSPFHQM